MKPKRLKAQKVEKNYQEKCIPFLDAVAKMNLINQPGMLVQYFKVVTISAKGCKLTMTFDAVKWLKEQQKKTK